LRTWRAHEGGLGPPGDLARLVLIQVQKTKVDVEVAMAALDRLLKANELNFTLLTLVPAAVAAVLVGTQARRLWARRQALATGDVHRVIRTQLW
jgi:nuclear control of ATPase protein 2